METNMKFLTSRWITLFVSICLLLLLPGCWDYESISTRASLIGLGIDPADDDPQKVRVTIQYPIIKPEESGGMSSSSASSSTGEYQSLSAEAYSVSEAIKHLQLRVDHQIDPAQLQAIVFNRTLPSEMMDSVVGQLIRLPKMNRLAYVFSTPDSAKDVLTVTGTNTAPMDFLDKSMTYRQRGFILRRQLWEYWRDTAQVGVVPILPTVQCVSSEDKGEDTLLLGGTEVYLHNQAAFSLSPQETFYTQLMDGKVRGMAFDVPLGDGIASLTDVRSNSTLRCFDQGKNVVLVDRVSIRATLGKLPVVSRQVV
ncbi:Ger(x)C family spore germination protein [Alicyclobacillus fastidiosus]|uniref:Ger(x)C family spore germination protein n=1 Tax=Alicyclobacillus fastidiosus TaxID=392011 RepID=UPI00404B4473